MKPLFYSLIAISSITSPNAFCGPKDQQMPGYNAPCRIDVKGTRDFFTFGSFTYFQPIQENMNLGVLSNTTNSADIVNGEEISLNFDYKPGFKVGIGMDTGYDNWDTLLQYTWFRGTFGVSRSLDPNNTDINLLPAWQIPSFLNPLYHFGTETWGLKLDLVDFELARGYSVGRKLCFRTFFGVRAAFIRQDIKVDYTNTNSSYLVIYPNTQIIQDTSSWGVGPRAGITTNWKFDHGFRAIGDGEIDILYTQYDTKTTETTEATFPNNYIVRKNNNPFLRTHLGLKIGLGWGTYFSNCRYHFDFLADYGFQAFFDQNMFHSAVGTFALGKSVSPNGNLYIHGLTITSRFDF
jgi:hypothetical protein